MNEPDIIVNHGSVWIAKSGEWARFDSREKLQEFIENLIEAREQAFPQEKKS